MIQFLGSCDGEICLVLLDPDTGLEPAGRATLKHVKENEVRRVWKSLEPGNLLVFSQHQTNRRGEPWVADKRD